MRHLIRRLERRNARYLALQSPVRHSLAEIQRGLAGDTLALVYAAAHDDLLLFALSRHGVAHYRLGSLKEMEAARQAWRASIERFLWLQAQMGSAYVERHRQSLLAAALEPAQVLYRTLLAPARAHLERYPRLVIVPDAGLHYLPFQALHDGTRYLAESHVVSYTPSLTALDFCRQLRPGSQGRMLVMAYSVGGRLPAVVAEARAIAPLFPEATLCCEEEARRPVLVEGSGEYEVVHLATHSRFRADSPLFSSLELADEPLWVYDVYNLRLRASLVTLSACDTGQGRLRGQELLGLTRGFLAAGAASVLVSLWAVDDRSTAALMRAFYGRLQSGLNRAGALQAAQESMLRSDTLAWRHPAHWAAFCLVGADGRSGQGADRPPAAHRLD
jgi:CHAT domain-containing protein